MGRFPLLISGFLDRDLADDEVERLANVLRSDPASLDRFVLNSFVHSQLLDWMDQQDGENIALSRAATVGDVLHQAGAADAIDDLLIGQRPSSGRWHTRDGGHTSRNRRRSWLWTVATLAATLLIAATLAGLGYVIVARPVIVAQLTQATGCRWEASQTEISVGTLLRSSQELNLVQGRALITFVNGAQVLLEGPASLRLDGVSQVHLHNGRVAAKVPTPARGFAVVSSLARFVDLGTEFTLKLDAGRSFDLHVFEGLVEVRLDQCFGDAARQPLRVTDVHAVHFDVETGDVANLHFEEGKQMPF